MAKSILITGASGFIGSFLVEEGLAQGYEVWAAVRRTSSRAYLQDERIRFIELNLENDAALTAQLSAHVQQHGAFSGVIHAAGATKCRRVADFYRINAEATGRLAVTLLETGALGADGRLVFVSSLSVYGALHEIDHLPLRETDQPQPNTHYGRSKWQAECLLAQVPGLNYVVLRPTGVYGPRERDYALMARSIRRHIDFAVGFKPQVLTFIYVKDLVQAAFLALTRGRSGAAYVLTDGKSYTSRAFSDLLQLELGVRRVLHITAPTCVLWLVARIAEAVARLRGTTSTLNADKYRIMCQRNWQADITPARRDLGYKPAWPLTRGVHDTREWYRTF